MRILRLIGITEILIGGVTLIATLLSLFTATSTKTPNVLLFVILAAITSTIIGIGILEMKRSAYLMLLYFSSLVIFSKILIFLDIAHLNGALMTSIPAPLKDTISLIYHAFIFYYLTRKEVQQLFRIE